MLQAIVLSVHSMLGKKTTKVWAFYYTCSSTLSELSGKKKGKFTDYGSILKTTLNILNLDFSLL